MAGRTAVPGLLLGDAAPETYVGNAGVASLLGPDVVNGFHAPSGPRSAIYWGKHKALVRNKGVGILSKPCAARAWSAEAARIRSWLY